MNLRILASLLVIVAIIYMQNARMRNKHAKIEKSFWSRENEANSVRKKKLDDLDYITIPFDTLPTDVANDDPEIKQIVDDLHSLSERNIVNFTGLTNTDLKLQYGTANITVLSEYDENFTVLANLLQKWASTLYKRGFRHEARSVLEFAMVIDSDVRQSYFDLARIYHEDCEDEKISALIKRADRLRGLNGPIISNTLKEKYEV